MLIGGTTRSKFPPLFTAREFICIAQEKETAGRGEKRRERAHGVSVGAMQKYTRDTVHKKRFIIIRSRGLFIGPVDYAIARVDKNDRSRAARARGDCEFVSRRARSRDRIKTRSFRKTLPAFTAIVNAFCMTRPRKQAESAIKRELRYCARLNGRALREGQR